MLTYQSVGRHEIFVCVCVRVFEFVPQACTHETSGLLYLDLLTSKMYRCTGVEWRQWGWNSAGDGLQYSTLLRDSVADQPPPQDTDDDDDNDDDDDDVTLTSRGQQAARGRSKSCRQGRTPHA